MQIFEKILEKLQECERQAEKDMGLSEKYAEANAYGGEMIAFEKAIEIVKQVAAEYNNGWIPCNGVLYPDDMEDVLINMGGLKAIPAYRQNGKWYLTDCRGSSTEVKDQSLVIEWQPLPKPYQKGE